MKLIIIILLSINLYCHENFFKSSFGFQKGLLLSSFKDERVSIKAWLEDVALQNKSKLSIKFYGNPYLLYIDFKKEKFDMIIVNSRFFFRNQRTIKRYADNFWSLSINGNHKTKYYLISQKNNNTAKVNIKNKSISLKFSDESSKTWLDKISLGENKKTFNKVVNKVDYVKKESTALLNVFFGKTQLAIISENTWKKMLITNPLILDKLKIIKKSPEIFLPFIGFFHKKANKKIKEMFFNLGSNLKNLEESERIIELLKFNHIYKLNKTKLKYLEKYYLDYFNLKKTYL